MKQKLFFGFRLCGILLLLSLSTLNLGQNIPFLYFSMRRIHPPNEITTWLNQLDDPEQRLNALTQIGRVFAFRYTPGTIDVSLVNALVEKIIPLLNDSNEDIQAEATLALGSLLPHLNENKELQKRVAEAITKNLTVESVRVKLGAVHSICGAISKMVSDEDSKLELAMQLIKNLNDSAVLVAAAAADGLRWIREFLNPDSQQQIREDLLRAKNEGRVHQDSYVQFLLERTLREYGIE